MALLESYGSGKKDGYDNVAIVQKALLAFPFKPLDMFGAARAALSATNDLTVSEYNCIPNVTGIPIKELDHAGIARLFNPLGEMKLRTLFNQYKLNADSYVTVFFGHDWLEGTLLICITQTTLGVIVTSVETKDRKQADFLERLKAHTVEPIE